jgi:membrane protease YdiL (CAAX protease family)
MKKFEYLKLILVAILLTITVSFFTAIGVVLRASDSQRTVLQMVAFLIFGVFLTLYMKKQDQTFQKFGFKWLKVNPIMIAFLAVIVLVQPIILGLNFDKPVRSILLLIVEMFVVGYTEEVLFRGIFWYKLNSLGPVFYIVFSSIIFGLMHSANAINPENPGILVATQILNAFLLGIVFAFCFYLTKNIFLLIFTHAIFDILASLVSSSNISLHLSSTFALTIIYLIFIGVFYKLNSSSKKILS